jgi:hypothetical protein
MSRAAATVLEQVLGHQRVHRGHAGDVDDRDPRAGVHDALEQVLHHHLGARAVQRADQRQAEHSVPQLHDRRRQLEHLPLLLADDLLARLLIRLGRVEAEGVQQRGGLPDLIGQGPGVASQLLGQSREHRLL